MRSSPKPRAERVEVRRSRAAILNAAEQHWAKRDADPTMAELAKLAGVGSATLYRRFPDIDAVAVALHEQLVIEFEQVYAAVRAQPTGWDGIVALVDGIINVLQAHRALPRLNRRMTARNDNRLGIAWAGPLNALVAQAQAEGTLRPDATANDITFAAFRLGAYSNLPPDQAASILGRQTQIVLDGLRAGDHRTALPGSPVSMNDLDRILQHEAKHPVD